MCLKQRILNIYQNPQWQGIHVLYKEDNIWKVQHCLVACKASYFLILFHYYLNSSSDMIIMNYFHSYLKHENQQ